MDIESLIRELTAEEKAALVAGTDFMFTNPVPRLGIPSLRMSDGPHGLRVQTEGGDNGVTNSLPATSFPTAATVASSWEPENSRLIGVAIGKEAHKYGIHVVLGPGANIKRNPLAGRNFEYFSEDPYLAGKMAAAEVDGIQSEGVGVSVKHFALNNAENFRFMGNSVADERAIREIYLKVFEIAVKESHPATMMCAYNAINGEYCSQNKWLLTDVLRKEWGFDGLVMTDWGAMHDRVRSLRAGLDLEMPGDTAICRKWILDGVKDGSLPMGVLDEAVKNVLTLVEKYVRAHPDDCDFEANDCLACKIAEDSAVLLKNDGILPLDEKEKLFVCGDLFEKMRYQGAGSSMINPTKLTTPKDAFDAAGIRYSYARGYAENSTTTNAALLREALDGAKKFQKVLVFAGLTDYVESEGCDREDMRFPENQLALIDALINAGKQVIVVLFGGSPVELPFAEQVSAILDMYLPGQSGGRACANLLFGKANPAGRLAETWPLRYEDVPFGETFGKSENEVYQESIFVGYCYYTTAQKKVRYPFGYGLSYTSFVWSDMQVQTEGENISVFCLVKNTGARDGAEVVQLYVSAPESKVYKPLRELKAFQKVRLAAGEEKEVCLTVNRDALRYFDVQKRGWALEGGEYRFELCSDAETVVLEQTITLEGEYNAPYPEDVLKVYQGANFQGLTDALFEKMSGQHIPPLPAKKPIRLESRFSNLKKAGFLGKILHSAVLSVATKQMKEAKKLPEGKEKDNKIKGAFFLRRILESNSLISMSMSAGTGMPYNFACGFMELANGHLFKGIQCFCSKIKVPKLPKEKDNER
ncbi:MAG TPA: glycoside hydrolase family 3 C-terminal domain-containing protein [Candidatus Gallimonas intestinavium]|uniref:Glycoside hydrolase family 3 C-terminal domain-containing protein n=1 Tax=Candidatus Gallimonas intestinavium TaxID=2838603 RepID=A0A9D2K010_9FIRM|nr:glycoside hydrolase family 3 C-terminal domain-containing protein [Candidatus Gallimonas intestinavium]